MKRSLFVCAALGLLALLVLPEGAFAQRRGGGGRESRGGGERSFGGERWGGDWNRGYGGWGYGGYGGYGGWGYGWPGYYGGNYGYGYGRPYNRGYYDNYYGDYGYQQPYYTYEDNSAPNYAYTDEGSMDQGQSNNTAAIRVILPAADAKVWFEGQETRQSGRDRTFISPPLESGKSFNYTIKAEWTGADGRPMTVTKTVPVQAGQRVVANFTQQRKQPAMEGRVRTGTEDRTNEEFDRTRNRAGARLQVDSSHPFVGKVASVNEDQVTVTDMQGANEQTFRIPAHANIMIDGKNGSATGLKTGMRVTITPEEENAGLASKIEANAAQSGTKLNAPKRPLPQPSSARPPN